MPFPIAPRYQERLRRAAGSARDLLVACSADRWEVFTKGSTTRQVEVRPDAPPREILVDEVGVAVRTLRGRRAGFASASGLDVDAARTAVDGAVSVEYALPFDPMPPSRLLGVTDVETTGSLPPRGWASHVTDQLRRWVSEVAAGRLQVRRAVFQEGTYAWLLTTAEGFVATHEDTASSLLVEVESTDSDHGVWREWVHIPDPATFDPEPVARRITDRALLIHTRPAPDSGLSTVILAPELAANLFASMIGLLVVGSAGDDPVRRLLDRGGRLASTALTLVDDRLDPHAPVTGPCDGEGLPARRTILVEGGIPRRRLASYRDAAAHGASATGGAVRLSYRDYPGTGAANLRVALDDAVPPHELLRRASRALYLLRPLTPVLIDLQRDSYRIVASGVWLEERAVVGWHPVVELAGSLSTMLRRIDAVGTDASWFQTGAGFVSSPSILVRRQNVS